MTSHNEDEDKTIYKVVVNHEEQYSIWPEYRENPPGWNDVGKAGLKAECLAYIKEVWTDMRPLSLRKKMEEMARNPPPPPPPADSTPKGPSLVDRLCTGDHHIEVSQRPEPSVKALKEAIDNGYVRIKFTETERRHRARIQSGQGSFQFRRRELRTRHRQGAGCGWSNSRLRQGALHRRDRSTDARGRRAPGEGRSRGVSVSLPRHEFSCQRSNAVARFSRAHGMLLRYYGC